ncbi:MAG: peptide deformylase [Phycisphaerales bacterium]|nr:peptide deformylase [Phycisphaerales bacterium]
MSLDLAKLYIIHYPDPRLRKRSAAITEFAPDLAAFAARMHELMRTGRGVGLAAPQVGVNVRLFVLNPTGEPQDGLTLVNPELHDPEGLVEAEEGCLSIPAVAVQVRRAQRLRVTAQDVQGRPFEFIAEDLVARICQHETDHLEGVLILDKQGPTDEIANRKVVRALEDAWRERYGRLPVGRR